jgi:hypothetical protein
MSTENKPTPLMPESFDLIYALVYKKGNVLSTLHFRAKNKEVAIEKGKRYCEKKQLRYVYVNTWLHDIDQLTEHSDEARL